MYKMFWFIILPMFKFNKHAETLKQESWHTEISFPTKFFLYNTERYVRVEVSVLGFGLSLGWRVQ